MCQSMVDIQSPTAEIRRGKKRRRKKQDETRMWANAQPDGRPAEHRWCPLFNAANFATAKFTLRPSFVFSYIASVTARHSSSGRQPNFVAWYMDWNYGTFAEGATYIWLGGNHVLLMVPYGIRQTIIFSCCDYGRPMS